MRIMCMFQPQELSMLVDVLGVGCRHSLEGLSSITTTTRIGSSRYIYFEGDYLGQGAGKGKSISS